MEQDTVIYADPAPTNAQNTAQTTMTQPPTAASHTAQNYFRPVTDLRRYTTETNARIDHPDVLMNTASASASCFYPLSDYEDQETTMTGEKIDDENLCAASQTTPTTGNAGSGLECLNTSALRTATAAFDDAKLYRTAPEGACTVLQPNHAGLYHCKANKKTKTMPVATKGTNIKTKFKKSIEIKIKKRPAAKTIARMAADDGLTDEIPKMSAPVQRSKRSIKTKREPARFGNIVNDPMTHEYAEGPTGKVNAHEDIDNKSSVMSRVPGTHNRNQNPSLLLSLAPPPPDPTSETRDVETRLVARPPRRNDPVWPYTGRDIRSWDRDKFNEERDQSDPYRHPMLRAHARLHATDLRNRTWSALAEDTIDPALQQSDIAAFVSRVDRAIDTAIATKTTVSRIDFHDEAPIQTNEMRMQLLLELRLCLHRISKVGLPSCPKYMLRHPLMQRAIAHAHRRPVLHYPNHPEEVGTLTVYNGEGGDVIPCDPTFERRIRRTFTRRRPKATRKFIMWGEHSMHGHNRHFAYMTTAVTDKEQSERVFWEHVSHSMNPSDTPLMTSHDLLNDPMTFDGAPPPANDKLESELDEDTSQIGRLQNQVRNLLSQLNSMMADLSGVRTNQRTNANAHTANQ